MSRVCFTASFPSLALVACAAMSASGQTQFLVMDSLGDRIVRFEWPTGQVIDHFVALGLTNLNAPAEGLFGPDGLFYVSGQASDNIRRFDGVTGKPLGELVPPGGGGIDLAAGMEIGLDGFLYVCSFNNDSVKRVDLVTGVVTNFITPGNGLDGPFGLDQDAAGDWYIACDLSDRVLRYSSAGVYIEEAIPFGTPGLDAPDDCLIDDQGRLFVTAYNTDLIFVKDLGTGVISQLITPGLGGLDGPNFMSFGPEPDALYVVGSGGTGQFLRYDRNTGAFLGAFLSPVSGGVTGDPIAVTFIPESNVCQADCDQSGSLNIFDYICFGNAYAAGCP